jgi:hypothetical protein
LGIDGVIFVAFDERLHELRRNQLGVMAHSLEHSSQVVGASAGLHYHRTHGMIGQECDHLLSRAFLAQDFSTGLVLGVQMKVMFADIDAD